jgi:hypothetical protein
MCPSGGLLRRPGLGLHHRASLGTRQRREAPPFHRIRA